VASACPVGASRVQALCDLRVRSRLTVGTWQVTVEILRSSFEGEDMWMATGDRTQCSTSGHIDLRVRSTRVVPSEGVQRLFSWRVL
jgi:hypothetical protein